MSCCIAAIASGGSHIILVADKAVGSSVGQGELNGVLKLDQVHDDWWSLFSGDPSLAGDLFARLKRALPSGPLSAENVDSYLSATMFEKWVCDTERRFLLPEGYDTESFQSEAPRRMRPGIYERVRTLRLAYELDASILLAGFDGEGQAHILSCTGFDDELHTKHVPANHDLAGYFGIGAGASGALWMMNYKNVGPYMSYVDVAYYAVEGKYYGERGHRDGELTDLTVLRHKKKPQSVNAHWLGKTFIPVCEKLRPRKLKNKNRKRLDKFKFSKN